MKPDQLLQAEGAEALSTEQLMTKSPKSCQPGHTLSEAAQMMRDHDCGCLPVTAGDGSQRLIGLITDRDICMAAQLRGRLLSEIRVRDAMAKEVSPRTPCRLAPCDDDFVKPDQPLWAGGGDAMRIEQLMTKSPKSCQPGHTLSEAAQTMWDHDCGCLPVTADDGSRRVIGMITDRDICMAAQFRGKTLRELQVREAMTKDVRTCNPGDALREAEAIMWEAHVRRLPVVDETDTLIGLLSLADLAREAERQHWKKKREITETEVGEALAMICQPRAIPRPAPED